MKNDLYKNFLVYDLCDDLKNINCLSSNFILNWKSYFEDEEFTKNNEFIKCPYCNSEHIKRDYIQNRNIESFIKDKDIFFNKNSTDSHSFVYLKHTLELLTISDGYAYIEFCDDCKKVITVNEKPFFFYYHISSTDYERLFIKENLFLKDNKPIYCPSCGSRNFFSEEDTEEYYYARLSVYHHIYCVRCKSYICSKKHNEYHINMNYFGKKFIM